MASGPGPTGREPLRDAMPDGARPHARAELDDDSALPQVRAVDCRRAVDRGTRPNRRRGALRRSAVHGERRQRGRLGAAGRVPPGRVGRRAAGCVQRNRPGLGPAGLSVGRARRARLRLASAAAHGATPICSTAIASITSSASIGRSCARRDGEARRVHARGRRPSRPRSASGCLRVFREPGAEIIAEDLGVVPDFVRAVARAARHPRLQGVALGAPLAPGGTAVQGPGGVPARIGRDVRHARYRADGRSGGREPSRRNAARCWRYRQFDTC